VTPTLHLATNSLYPFPLADGGVALIDAGPDIEGSWADLRTQLRALDLPPSEVRLVLVTHAHADHAGLAARWAAEGARVLGGAADLEALRAGAEGYAATRAAREAELRRHGCPESVLEAIAARPRSAFAWAGCPDVEAALDGATFALADGRRLRVLAAPGHTPGNLVVLVEDPEGVHSLEVCSGDTLLPDTIPTPGLHFPHGPDGPRWPSLPPFLHSMRALGALPLARALPGHSAPVEEPRRLIARFEAHHARRAARVRAALAAGPLTAFEVARALFPRLPAPRLGQALTEVIGHFDLLLASGVGVLEEDGGVVRVGV
jgi:glyoxylase-like metal-dependent hydrolase (beta-lactamase superfamily II)